MNLHQRGRISGAYHSVSPQHLQKHLNEYTFRYNHYDGQAGSQASLSVIQWPRMT